MRVVPVMVDRRVYHTMIGWAPLCERCTTSAPPRARQQYAEQDAEQHRREHA